MKITTVYCLFLCLVTWVTKPCSAEQLRHSRLRLLPCRAAQGYGMQFRRVRATCCPTQHCCMHRKISPAPQQSCRIPGFEHALRILREHIAAVDSVRDYDCVLLLRNRDSGSELRTVALSLKTRRYPLSIYAYYWAPPSSRHLERAYHHQRGDASLLQMDVRSALCRAVHELTLAESSTVTCAVAQTDGAAVNGKSCRLIEIQCVQASPDPTRLVQLLVYEETGFPARVALLEQSNGDQKIIWDYTYVRVRTDLGMTDESFTIKD